MEAYSRYGDLKIGEYSECRGNKEGKEGPQNSPGKQQMFFLVLIKKKDIVVNFREGESRLTLERWLYQMF